MTWRRPSAATSLGSARRSSRRSKLLRSSAFRVVVELIVRIANIAPSLAIVNRELHPIHRPLPEISNNLHRFDDRGRSLSKFGKNLFETRSFSIETLGNREQGRVCHRHLFVYSPVY